MGLKDHLETFFCDIIELKQKKIDFYREWANKCDDTVGRDVMKAIEDAEEKDLERLRTAHEEFARTNQADMVCRYIPERVSIADVLINKAVEVYRRSKESACASVRIPFEIGLDLEEKAIALFRKYSELAETPEEKEFFEAFIAEEKEHIRLLTDIKYYYEDPQGWFMEKGRGGLDGA